MLPFVKSTRRKSLKQIVAFRGINYSDYYQNGDLRESMNLSTRRFPYLTTRRARLKMEEYSGATAMTARGELVVVQGTDLIYDGEVVGQVTEGEKQFAVVNTKLIIWPDKVYLDLTTKTMGALGARVEWPECAFYDTGEVTLAVYNRGDGVEHVPTDLRVHFKVGDAVKISGSAVEKHNKELVVKAVEKHSLHFGEGLFDDTPTSALESLVLERRVPDLDFICESENRLWGCSSATQTIYASALGDPTNFFVYEGLSTDGYAVAVGTEGDFTGCCKHSSSVLFWKETKLHKLLGSYPAEYSVYDYTIEGLQKGSHKSLQIINEVLYYLGAHGVYAYSGGMPSLISAGFGEKRFKNGVGGNDGDTYYLSAWEGDVCSLMVYETRSGFWFREDATNAVDFARISSELYMLDDKGEVWLMDNLQEDPTVEWMAQFAPFHESAEGRKLFSKIILRVEMPRGAWMRVEVRYDDGKWREAGKILGRELDSIPVQLPINRCDKFDVRLSGYGPCTIKAMVLEYSMGSDA